MKSSHLHRARDAFSVAQNFVEIFRPQDVSQSRLCQQPEKGVGEIEKEYDFNVHVSVIAGGPKPRLDFSHKIRVGRWSLGAGVENSNHYDLFGIFWTHLGKACKPDHQISDMNVSKSFFKHQFTLITARFARILLSFPLFVGNSL